MVAFYGYCFTAFFILITLIACSGKNSGTNNSEDDDNTDTIEATDDGTGLTMEIIQCNNYENSESGPTYSYDDYCDYKIAFKYNGEYIMFDNDADYQALTNLTLFLRETQKNLCDAYRSGDDGFSKHTNKDLLSPEFIALLKDLPHNINLYVGGKKAEIINRNVFKVIDKTYYNDHPFTISFQLESSRYGYKRYEDQVGWSITFMSHEPYTNLPNYRSLDGEIVPEGVLTTMWW